MSVEKPEGLEILRQGIDVAARQMVLEKHFDPEGARALAKELMKATFRAVTEMVCEEIEKL